MKINWKIRLMNKTFWMGMIPALTLVVQRMAALLGLTLPVEAPTENLLNLVEAVFALLTVLGVAADPTTEGLNDSDRALAYVEPGVLPGGED